MTLGGVLGAVRRRWYVIIAGILVTVGAGWAVFNYLPQTYSARGLILLLPAVPADEVGGNPFLNLGGLDVPARVLVATYSSNAFLEEINDRAPDAEVEVLMEEATRGPVISIDVSDSTADGALETLAYVAESVPETLANLQSEVGVPLDASVTSMPLTMDTEAEPDNSTVMRLLIAVGAVGLAASVAVAYALDGVLGRRIRRTPQRFAPDEPPRDPSPDQTEDFASTLSILRSNFPAEPMRARQDTER